MLAIERIEVSEPEVKNMNEHQARRFADRATTTAREAMQKGTTAAEESTRGIGNGFFAAAKAAGDLNVKLIAMAQGNAMAAFTFVQQVATAKGPFEAASLWSCYARERFETLADQSRELTELAQRVMTSTVEPLTHGFGQTHHAK
jgi:phasin